jgi:hypothetical protein
MITSMHRSPIFLFSSARSGSTWLAKIFDSRPDVLYLHEPDLADRGLDLLPYWFEDAPTDRQTSQARRYLERLIKARTPRATGTRPFFSKTYRNPVQEITRRGLIYVAKAGERSGADWFRDHMKIPDLSNGHIEPMIVLKSVTGLGRVESFLKASNGQVRPILLIRHPCGYVRSMLQGEKLGLLNRMPALGTLLDTRSARALSAREALNGSDDVISRLAWDWLLSNSEAQIAVKAAHGVTVTYETLARDTLAEIRRLFARIGLDWQPETEEFLGRASKPGGTYYSVFRDAAQSVDRWRGELDGSAIERIRAITSRGAIGREFFPN